MAEPQSPTHTLTGSYRVRVWRPVLQEATRLCPRVRDYYLLYAQAKKLRFWPHSEVELQGGHVLDLDWEWIRALRPQEIGELRVHDEIGGNNNLRIIFYVGDKSVKAPLPIIWIVALLQKKRDDFTHANLETFKGRVTLVKKRFYEDREFL